MAARNKQQIIHIASRLFVKKGYKYTTIEDILKASGVSKSNLYFHFNSKEEILLSSVHFWANRYEAALEISLEKQELAAKERIMDFINQLISEIETRDGKGYCPFISLYEQCPEDATEVSARIEQFFVNLHQLIAKLIEQGINNGEFRLGINAKDCAYLFVSSLEGALVLAETIHDISIVKTTISRLFILMST